MHIELKKFDALSNKELYDMLTLRNEVFVVEQNCVYQDLDGKDIHDDCCHVLMTNASSLLAYSRLLPPGLSFEQSSIGRVLVAETARGKGIATELMNFSIEQCKHIYSTNQIKIGAQCYLTSFYASLGFVIDSDPYDEDGIQHVEMLYTD